MKYLDICVNLLNGQFKNDRDKVVEDACSAGVEFLVTATDLSSTREAIAYCRTRGLRCTAGVHPHDAGTLPSDWLEELASLAQHAEVCAIGETGLDFNRNYSPAAVQREVFAAQIELAQRLDKPLFVHDRDTNGEVLEMLLAAGPLPPTTVHCFTGSADELRGFIAAGFFIGITGWIADQSRGGSLRELVAQIPGEQLLMETDAPFLRPHNAPPASQSRLRRRNEPALLPYVCEAIAACREESAEELAAICRLNAQRAFRLETALP